MEDCDSPTLSKLESACSDLKSFLETTSEIGSSIMSMEKRFTPLEEALSTASKRIAPIQSLAIATKSLETRINRAVNPALVLLDSFKITESLQHKLLEISTKLSSKKSPKRRLSLLIRYVDCVDKLNIAINLIAQEGEPAIHRLQEVVEFLSRTKATDQYRAHRLRDTLVTLKALYETEVDAMKFDGLLDEALLFLQDEFEATLLQLRHRNVGFVGEEEGDTEEAPPLPEELGSEMEVEVLRRIAETLAANDCLDICIDIFVKVRYRRAAKALMRLNPDYLKTYLPEEINKMEWESLETSITLWIKHFELAVKTVFLSEKSLCNRVLHNVRDGAIWPECFVKIADKIMAVFFRFGEGVARSNKEPQKLFKLLDMFDSLEKLKPEFCEIFEGDAGSDICSRFRELEKLLVHISTRVFWEFGLQIEGNELPPPQDGSVPKLVRYAINYLKYLLTDNFSHGMAKVLRTEQIWKSGVLSKPNIEEDLLRDAIFNIMEALQRNVESRKACYKDRVLSHVFAMNSYWYIYMRSRNTELGTMLGEQYTREKYKVVAEESAYLYQKQAWGGVVRLLDREETDSIRKEGIGAVARGKMEAFLELFDEMCRRHKSAYTIPEVDLREQIKEATINFVVPTYTEFMTNSSSVLQAKYYPSPESIEDKLCEIFASKGFDQKPSFPRRREFRGRKGSDQFEGKKSVSIEQSWRNEPNTSNVQASNR